MVECLVAKQYVVSSSLDGAACKTRVEPRGDYSHEFAMFLQRGICLTISSGRTGDICIVWYTICIQKCPNRDALQHSTVSTVWYTICFQSVLTRTHYNHSTVQVALKARNLAEHYLISDRCMSTAHPVKWSFA